MSKLNNNSHILIYKFVKSELQYLIDNCNFTDEELQYFTLKSRNNSNGFIADELNVSSSKVSIIAKNVKSKISKVLT